MSLDRNEQLKDEEFWLFGYGSLIWKPPPHFDRRIPGWVTGYVRRFWQASQDHRGTPESPGRVVTLISRDYWSTLSALDPHPSPPDNRVWGVAYRIVPARVAEVKEYLDIREINGYTIHYAPFHPAPSSSSGREGGQPASGGGEPETIKALVYIGTPANAQFVGPQDPQALAEHIYRSAGPSGLNRDYLFGLERSLDELSPESRDEHVRDLAERVRGIAAREAERETESVGPGIVSAPPSAVPAAASCTTTTVVDQDVREEEHSRQHEFRRADSVDEQEETEK